MAQVLRVSLPGYNALTEIDPRHFNLLTDSDYVLPKLSVSGDATANAGETITVAHNLGYLPLFFTANNYGWTIFADNTNLYLVNDRDIQQTCSYYIYLDEE